MIDCNNIKQELEELRMKMKECTILKAEDMRKLVDLLLALEDCKCNCYSSPNLPSNTSSRVYSYQFGNLTDDISNVSKVDSSFLTAYGTSYTYTQVENGVNIPFSNIGRIGFMIEEANNFSYQIFDVLNNDVTNTMFDTHYNSVEDKRYYISKDYMTPSTLYFKFKILQ